MDQEETPEQQQEQISLPPQKHGKKLLWIMAALFIALFILLELAGVYVGISHRSKNSADGNGRQEAVQDISELKNQNAKLQDKIQKLSPADVAIIIDTGRNRLFLKKKDKVVLEAIISSGSGNVLDDPKGGRQWVFDTPRGAYTVQSKHKAPVWRKPDWAFIEEGKDIPKKAEERLEEGMLGDYALGFGNGFFIHGTLYTRLLGRNVTHGCVRVGDKDLETVFATARIGDRIFIF